jgi:glycosyltransferase involved in cell wall biosynthesis
MISKCAHHIITADETIARHFSNTHHSVTTLFNYPVMSIFQPDVAKIKDIEEQFNGYIPIIYHGGMSQERGLFHMLEAMIIVRQTNPNIILLLVGNLRGILREQVDIFIDNHELQEHIKIIGHVHHEDLVNYIAVCKVGLVPLQPTRKFLKNIPTKQFEYMLCGLPVIGANMPPITNYTGKANSGIIIDPTNPEELASAIIRVTDDSAAWEMMSRNGKQAVSESWNWGNMEIRLYNIYDKFLN